MKVIVASGKAKGITGEINGDLEERRKTLGKEGKVMVRTGRAFPHDILWVRVKHLHSDQDLFS